MLTMSACAANVALCASLHCLGDVSAARRPGRPAQLDSRRPPFSGDLPADGRGSTCEPSGYSAYRLTGHQSRPGSAGSRYADDQRGERSGEASLLSSSAPILGLLRIHTPMSPVPGSLISLRRSVARYRPIPVAGSKWTNCNGGLNFGCHAQQRSEHHQSRV